VLALAPPGETTYANAIATCHFERLEVVRLYGLNLEEPLSCYGRF
jgi:hypothetical protein